MWRTSSLFAGLFLMCAVAASGPAWAAKPVCGDNTGQKAAGKPIPIGGITSMTGLGSFKEGADAVAAYFHCLNDNGGIHGRPVLYHAEDDQSKIDIAAQAAKKLIDDEGVYALIGSTSFIECVANADYYLTHNVLDIGAGVAPQCFQSKNIAEVNAGPRQAAIGAVDYARRKLGAKSIVCSIVKYPGSDYVCHGVEDWGKRYGVRVISIYADPVSPDYTSLVLQIMGSHADAVQLMYVDDQGAQILNAVQQQDGGGKMKWTGSGALYTAPFVKAIDGKYWNDRLWIDTEQAPLESTGPDNQNWRAVMDAYAPTVVKDVFSQMGYVTARIAEKALMSIKNPDDINRQTTTAAIQNMAPYSTDIFCAPWYWGGPDVTIHQGNHVTSIFGYVDGQFKQIEGCHADADPGLGPIISLEKKLGINREINAGYDAAGQ
jgi:branched-chain amino acid transport system substrate-binding protein